MGRDGQEVTHTHMYICNEPLQYHNIKTNHTYILWVCVIEAAGMACLLGKPLQSDIRTFCSPVGIPFLNSIDLVKLLNEWVRSMCRVHGDNS